ncbi:hypothetical protein ACQEVS_15115 [Streptomyces sp. CA-181903]|uniref:hypothetical protein n=1 Tax=Streptomyces sp. CA-181903 TaxID=3240055 RepID=UPI003D926F3F
MAVTILKFCTFSLVLGIWLVIVRLSFVEAWRLKRLQRVGIRTMAECKNFEHFRSGIASWLEFFKPSGERSWALGPTSSRITIPLGESVEVVYDPTPKAYIWRGDRAEVWPIRRSSIRNHILAGVVATVISGIVAYSQIHIGS